MQTKFRFGHTHPEFSNSGLETIIALAYAGKKTQQKLTSADLNDQATRDFINAVESSVAHYGSSTGFFGDSMFSRGPDYLTAAVVYENIVVNGYDPKNQGKGYPALKAIYPKEGTLLSDHPVCIPNASWVSADQKEAADIYRKYLLSNPVQQQALTYGFRPADTTIKITKPLDTDHGVSPTQLQNLLPVPDADTINTIRALWKAQKRQVNLTMLIDISGSMGDNQKIDKARDGAKAFIDQLDDGDILTLIKFDDKQDIVFENQPVGPNWDQLKQQVDTLAPRNSTAIYDSLAFAVQHMKIDPKRINAIVLMTDGEDTASAKYHSPDGLAGIIGSKAKGPSADILVFTIGSATLTLKIRPLVLPMYQISRRLLT